MLEHGMYKNTNINKPNKFNVAMATWYYNPLQQKSILHDKK